MRRLYRSKFKTNFLLNKAFKACPDQKQRLQSKSFSNTRLFLSHMDRLELPLWEMRYRMVKNNIVFRYRNKIIERLLTASLAQFISRELNNAR